MCFPSPTGEVARDILKTNIKEVFYDPLLHLKLIVDWNGQDYPMRQEQAFICMVSAYPSLVAISYLLLFKGLRSLNTTMQQEARDLCWFWHSASGGGGPRAKSCTGPPMDPTAPSID